MVYGPSVFDGITAFQVHHFIQYFWVKTYQTVNNQLGIQIQYLA